MKTALILFLIVERDSWTSVSNLEHFSISLVLVSSMEILIFDESMFIGVSCSR
jgi:hypothetical protein